jgi:hypothetical protein
MKGHENPWGTKENSCGEIKQSTKVISRGLEKPTRKRSHEIGVIEVSMSSSLTTQLNS